MNIAIINLAQDLRPLGALNVASFLAANNYRNSFLYFITPPYSTPDHPEADARGQEESLVSFLASQRPDIVCFSFMTIYFSTARQLATRIKQTLPSSLIVLGGIHPTVSPDECLEFGDVVCLGEGEEPLYELVRALDQNRDYSKIENLWFRHNGTVQRNGLRHLCEELDERAFPAIDWENTFVLKDTEIVQLTAELFDKYSPRKGTLYDVMASRGCPYSCRYCCNSIFNEMNRTLGKTLRFRSVDHVISELEYVKATFPKVKIIDFQDDALGVAKKGYVEEFCEAYRSKIGLPFHLRVIPTKSEVSERNLALFKQAGLMSVVMGLQGSDKMNREIYNRPTTQKTFIDVARIIRKHDLIGRYDVIIDNPYSTEEDEIEAIRTFNTIPKPYGLIIYSLAFFPFTELTKKAIADGKYDPSSSGYETGYGNKRHRYPILAKMIKMTPYTPSWLIDIFLRIHRQRLGAMLVSLYYSTVFRLERKLIIRNVKRSAGSILFVRKVLLRVFSRQGRRTRAVADAPSP